MKKGSTKGLSAKNRFNIDIKVSGSLIPGSTVTIKAIVHSLLPSSNAHIQILLPEIAALKQDSKMLAKSPLPVQLSKHRSLGKGQASIQKTMVHFDKPGYYQVIASATNENNNDLLSSGAWIRNSGSRDIWLWISKDGGKVTEEYDSSLVAKRYRNQPGPLTKKTELPAIQTRNKKESVNILSADETTIAVDYINQTSMSAEPLANARMSYDVYDALGRVQGSAMVVLDNNGEAPIPCYEDFRGSGSYSASIHTQDNYRLSVYHYGSDVVASFSGNFDTDCGQIIPIRAGYKLSHVFETLKQVIENSRSFFQEQRGKVQVNVTPNVNNSYYEPSSDLIYIMDKDDNNTHVGEAFGDFTVAHEYGHALQEKGLDGNAASGQCPNSHFVDGGYNLQCAYSEGFADYHASAVGFPYFDFESTDYSRKCTERDENNYCINHASTPDGSIVEGGVAAFLYDLTDPANENQDDVQYAGHYVAEILKSCDVYHSIYGWTRANGVDHLIACFDQRIPNYDFNFDTRTIAPTNYREQAAEPSDWDDYQIRRIWNKTLYDETIAPPSNDLTVSYSGPGSLTSNKTATWTSNVSNGTAPYTYKWYVDGVLQQTHQGSADDSFTWTAGYSNFTLKLNVTDNNGESNSQESTVVVSDCSSVQTNNPQPCN